MLVLIKSADGKNTIAWPMAMRFFDSKRIIKSFKTRRNMKMREKTRNKEIKQGKYILASVNWFANEGI